MEQTNKKYSQIDHTADLGVEIWGQDFSSLLENAGTALFELITDVSQVSPRSESKIRIAKNNPETMLREWLEWLLTRFNIDGLLFSNFQVKIQEKLLSPSKEELLSLSKDDGSALGKASGEVYHPDRHTIHTEIKGITYHQFEVSQTKNGWYARIIFDV